VAEEMMLTVFFEKRIKLIQLEFFDLLIVIDGKPTVYRLKKIRV